MELTEHNHSEDEAVPTPGKVGAQQHSHGINTLLEGSTCSSASCALSSGDISAAPPSHERPHFLDNLKVFLTFTVVQHHLACAFGGCDRWWYLVVVNYKNPLVF